MKILVTGGAGFIGSNLADALIEKTHEVVILDNLSTGVKNNLNPEAKFYEGDVEDAQLLEKIFSSEKIEVVYHLAAQIDVRKSVENPVSDAKTNILGTLNLLNIAAKYKIKHFVFSSTGGAIYGDTIIPTPETAYENPVSPYGCAKLSIEKYLHFFKVVHGLNYTALRYANVYGPRQNPHGEAGVVAIFLNRMLNGENPKIFGGTQTRDYVYVSDVVNANLLALEKKAYGVFNVGTGVETSVNTLFQKLNTFFNNKFTPEMLPQKPGEQQTSCLSCEKISKAIGWKPEVSLDEGLRRTCEWFINKVI